MSKLEELEAYSDEATGQAAKVARLTVEAIREMQGDVQPTHKGYQNGQPVYAEDAE
jgi:hypothetical protein